MVTLQQPLCLLFKKLATRLGTETAFRRTVHLQPSFFFSKSSRRRLQKGSVLRGENREIFRS